MYGKGAAQTAAADDEDAGWGDKIAANLSGHVAEQMVDWLARRRLAAAAQQQQLQRQRNEQPKEQTEGTAVQVKEEGRKSDGGALIFEQTGEQCPQTSSPSNPEPSSQLSKLLSTSSLTAAAAAAAAAENETEEGEACTADSKVPGFSPCLPLLQPLNARARGTPREVRSRICTSTAQS